MTTIEPISSDSPPLLVTRMASPRRVAPGSVLGLVVWAVILLAGFAIVLGLGSPLQDDASLLERAYNPVPPVSEAQAIQAAETIVRHDYPEYAGGARSVTHQTDFNDDRYTITYAIPRQATGVRISISVKGTVNVSTYP